ncbi:osteocrin isoform X2 [Cetorhinus maximus]
MIGSRQNFLHLLLLLNFIRCSDGTAPGTEVAGKPSDLSPWVKAALTSASVEGNELGPSDWLPLLHHLARRQVDAASKRKRRRSVPQSGFRSNRGSVKPKTVKSKQRKVLDGRKRRVNFPMDRIGRMYLPKISY